MKSNISLYKFESGVVNIDNDYIMNIPEFKIINRRLIKSLGDADGRKKFENEKHLMYIEMVANLFSYPNQGGYTEKEIHKAACTEAGLDISFKPDKEILAAIDKFREIQLACLPTLESVNTSIRGLRLSTVITKTIIGNIEKKLEKYNQTVEETLSRNETPNIADEQILIDSFIDQLEKMNKIAITIPKTQEVLEKLEEKLLKESKGAVAGRGGKSIGNRADPD